MSIRVVRPYLSIIVAEILDLRKKIGCNPSVAKKTIPESTSQNSRTFLWIAGLAALGAVFTHLYLLVEHVNLKFGQSTGKSLCDINELFSCATVAASQFSEFLGIPVALWGLTTNAALLLMIVFYPLSEEQRKPIAGRNLLIVGGLIAAVSLVMGAISIFVLSKLCPFCIVAYILSFITIFGLWKSVTPEPGLRADPSRQGFQFANIKSLLIVGLVIFVISFIGNEQIKKSYGFQNMGAFVQAQVNEWKQNPESQIQPVDPLIAGSTPEQAKMVITEFADFRCGHCKTAAPVLKAFVSSHPDVRLQFQSWPLDGECNSSVSSTNGASCLLARAVYCAEKVGGTGWKAHDFVFEKQETYTSLQAVEGGLPAIANAAGVNPEHMLACTQSPEAKKAIEGQAAVGSALNLRGTPTIYVNGRRLPGAQSLPVLREVYRQIRAN